MLPSMHESNAQYQNALVGLTLLDVCFNFSLVSD